MVGMKAMIRLNDKETSPMKIWLTIFAVSVIALTVMGGCTSPQMTTSGSTSLRIITENYPPFNFVDKDNYITGQSTEIVRELLEMTGTQAEIEIMPLSEGLELAQAGPDTAIYSINRTTQREELYKWVGPIGAYEQAFYAKKGAQINIETLEDAKKVDKIGVYKSDAGNEFLKSQGFTNLDESLTDVEALQKLADGKVTLWLGNTRGLAATAQEAGVNPDDLELIPGVVINADLYIAFSKDVSDNVISEWQKQLDSLKKEQDIDGKTFMDRVEAEYDDPEYVQSLLK